MFKLAGYLGKTVAELSATLSLDELREWQAFDRVDPIGGYRGDLQAASIAFHTVGKKGDRLSDYLVINPNPMTDEQKQALAKEQEKRRLLQVLSLVQKHGKPLDK